MTRLRLILVAMLVVGVGSWMVLRTGNAVHADGMITHVETIDDEPESHNEEAARKRWQTSQARHWRHLVVQR